MEIDYSNSDGDITKNLYVFSK